MRPKRASFLLEAESSLKHTRNYGPRLHQRISFEHTKLNGVEDDRSRARLVAQNI